MTARSTTTTRTTNDHAAVKAAAVRLILFDVDGVLTDGRVLVHADGTESKTFAIRDGIAMVWAQRADIKVGLLSARYSATTPHRAAQLGITLIYQGVSSKLEAYERILATERLSDQDVAYMGDDIVDLAVLARAGFSCAPGRRRAGSAIARRLGQPLQRRRRRRPRAGRADPARAGSWDAVVSSYEHEPAGGSPRK